MERCARCRKLRIGFLEKTTLNIILGIGIINTYFLPANFYVSWQATFENFFDRFKISPIQVNTL